MILIKEKNKNITIKYYYIRILNQVILNLIIIYKIINIYRSKLVRHVTSITIIL
jgi:hypothetical protein